jgi:hypothetical protein
MLIVRIICEQERLADGCGLDYRGAHNALFPWPIDENQVCQLHHDGGLFDVPIYSHLQPGHVCAAGRSASDALSLEVLRGSRSQAVPPALAGARRSVRVSGPL